MKERTKELLCLKARAFVMGRRLGIILGGWVLVCAASAQAGDDMQARLEAAKTNYESANFDADLKLTAEIEAHVFAVAIAKRGGKTTEDVSASIEKIVLPEYLAVIDQKRQIFIHALAENLTVSDLSTLTAFYKTPEGKKYTSARVLILRSIYMQSIPVTKGANVSAWLHHKDEFEKLDLIFGEQKP